ncbi:MAG TPA: phenylalanine--tRNA ligase subunit alpha, partial [Spirochaetia bacterium]|nr:phenylalanine--tRNA ligase subunit alpha [Spirochaetia bacterium]
MNVETILKTLHPLEVRVLRHYSPGDPISAQEMIESLGFNLGQCNQALSWLSAKECVAEHSREQRVVYELTELGRTYRTGGTPEERIVAHVQQKGPARLPEIAIALGLDNKDVGSAYGALSREGLLAMDGEKRVTSGATPKSAAIELVRGLLDRTVDSDTIDDRDLSESERSAMAGISKKRGATNSAFRIAEREDVTYRLTDDGKRLKEALVRAGMTGDEIGSLTPEMLKDGSWKNSAFRAYNIQFPPGRLIPGRRNAYSEYLDQVKDKLTSLGFEEFDGPLVETEFWNSDALFMPQFHSARDIHDVYYIKNPDHAKAIEEPYLSQVAQTHENGWKTGSTGWNYAFDRDFTRRQILRSQGTVLSAKTLPHANVPGRYFGIVRCFRYDKVDATHLSDFYQTEGIVLGEDVNLRTLLGLLKMFAEELAGATEVKYVPGYFPFTEPSVEVHIKHPVLGWFELGGSGIFRPEVTEP